MSRHIINSAESTVVDAIKGLVACHAHLRFLDGFPEIKVVVDAAHDKSRVALISGGGSGHEPAHAGYVGSGMLAAAVCGDVFASPSAEAVLAAIRTVTGPAGCLLIVKNYTGDRLQFGMAAEQAKSEGYQVEMVVVGEDCAIEQPGLAGRRGLAGTCFVHKVAGAAAALGLPLEQVAAVAQQVADSVGTLGVALSVCTLPGKAPTGRIQAGEVEVGLGIHGEPGYQKAGWQPASQLVPAMLQRVLDYGQGGLVSAPLDEVALMVNNLGGTTGLETSVVVREALAFLEGRCKVVRIYCGHFMTSLDMSGVSLTLLRLTPEHVSLLDAPASAPGWPAASPVCTPNKKPLPLPNSSSAATATAGGRAAAADQEPPTSSLLLQAAIRAAAEKLVAAADELNELDAKTGDGDCGDTLRRGAEQVLCELQAGAIPTHDAAAAAHRLGHIIRLSIGGSSGGLYGVFLMAVERCLRQQQQQQARRSEGLSSSAAVTAFSAGVEAVQMYGGAKAGYRTMLDALLPAERAMQEAVAKGSAAADVAAAGAAAAAAGAEATKEMAALAGRSSYVPEEVLRSHADPGAKAVALWLGAVAAELEK